MDQCFDFAVGLHSHKRMVGTRKVLREEEEVQPNGKVFLKWDMGDYSWKSYAEVSLVPFLRFCLRPKAQELLELLFLLDFSFGLCINNSHHRATPNFYVFILLFIYSFHLFLFIYYFFVYN